MSNHTEKWTPWSGGDRGPEGWDKRAFECICRHGGVMRSADMPAHAICYVDWTHGSKYPDSDIVFYRFVSEEPEPDETWESWYHAAFDLAREKVGNIISSGRYEGGDLHQRVLGTLDDFAGMTPEVEPTHRSRNVVLPEILEALSELLDAYSYCFPVGNPWGDKARAAIAKAEGGAA